MTNKPIKTALGNILDKMNEIKTVDGGSVSKHTTTPVPISPPPQKKTIPNNTSKLKKVSADKIISVHPDAIKNWSFHDRPQTELGDIDALSEEFRTIGQQQPCIVRPATELPYQYELIAGERRWRAAKKAKIHLSVIVKSLSDNEAALCQAAENSNRQDLSSYAKGMNYAALIKSNIISRKDLQEKLNLSKSSIRNLLSYPRIDDQVMEAIGGLSKISPATAYEITRLQEKGSEYKDALIHIAPRLSNGKIGHNTIEKTVVRFIGQNDGDDKAMEIMAANGRHLFTWRKDSNGKKSISFPKDIRKIVNFDLIEKAILQEIEEQVNNVK